MLSIKIKDIYPCQDIEHVYAIVRESPGATRVVRAGDLVPAGTMLVSPAVEYPRLRQNARQMLSCFGTT